MFSIIVFFLAQISIILPRRFHLNLLMRLRFKRDDQVINRLLVEYTLTNSLSKYSYIVDKLSFKKIMNEIQVPCVEVIQEDLSFRERSHLFLVQPKDICVKWNHDSGTTCLLTADMDMFRRVKLFINFERRGLFDYSRRFRENQYSSIKKRAFTEELKLAESVVEFKWHVFSEIEILMIVLKNEDGLFKDFYFDDTRIDLMWGDGVRSDLSQLLPSQNTTKIKDDIQSHLKIDEPYYRIDVIQFNDNSYASEITFNQGGNFDLMFWYRYNELEDRIKQIIRTRV